MPPHKGAFFMPLHMEHCLNLSLTCSATPKEMLGWWQRSYIKIKPPLREGCAADPGVVSTKLTEGLLKQTHLYEHLLFFIYL